MGLPLLLPGEGLDLKTHKIAKVLICKKKPPDIAEKVERKGILDNLQLRQENRRRQTCTISSNRDSG